MSGETKASGNSNAGSKGAGSGGFRAKMDTFLYSGDRKHVMAGIGIITLIFGIPWYLMSKGSKHQSHQDYLEKADKARNQRLSSSSSSAK